MKILKQFKVSVLLITLLMSAVTKADLPPIEHFSKHGQFHDIKLSPTGEYFAASMTNEQGKTSVGIINRKTNKLMSSVGWLGQEFPVSFLWLNEERIGVYVAIKLGARDAPIPTGEVVAMNVDGTKKRMLHGFRNGGGLIVNPSFETMTIIDLLIDDPKNILVVTQPSTKDGGYAEAHKLNIYSGKKRKIIRSPLRGGGLWADHNGVIRFATGQKADKSGNKVLLYYREGKAEDWNEIGEYTENTGFMTPIMFTRDNKKIYVTSNLDSKTSGVYIYDPRTNKRVPIAVNNRVDIADLDFDWNKKLFAAHFEPDYSKVQIIDEEHVIAKWYPALISAFNGANVSITSSTMDMSELTLKVISDKNPGSFYTFSTKTKKLTEVMKTKPWLESEFLGTTEAFSLKARDGVEVYGYLTLPKGKESNLPMVVIPHGGPHGPRDYWTYDDDVQLLASRGYAVLKVNFRGSGGYGLDFQSKGYRNWGSKIMDDITDSVLWAVSNGIADKDRLCIYGGSFGGYASLMSVVKEPDLYKCAIGYVGIYDLDLLFKKGDIPGSMFGRNYLKKVIGSDKSDIDEFSPARHVNKIKADLFIVHGEKDIRAHYDHALLLKENLDREGVEYQWLTKPKEGHGFYNEENRKELYTKMLAFLDKNIGSE
jgi:dipeptidyl aminopeptidase/acylaminoacyl peptidase